MGETTVRRRCWCCGAEYTPLIFDSITGRGTVRIPHHDRPDGGGGCPAGGELAPE